MMSTEISKTFVVGGILIKRTLLYRVTGYGVRRHAGEKKSRTDVHAKVKVRFQQYFSINIYLACSVDYKQSSTTRIK